MPGHATLKEQPVITISDEDDPDDCDLDDYMDPYDCVDWEECSREEWKARRLQAAFMSWRASRRTKRDEAFIRAVQALTELDAREEARIDHADRSERP